MFFYIYPIVPYAPAFSRSKGYRPETPFIFLLVGTGIVLVLFYSYPIVPYAPAFSHSFLLLVTDIKGIDPKRFYTKSFFEFSKRIQS